MRAGNGTSFPRELRSSSRESESEPDSRDVRSEREAWEFDSRELVGVSRLQTWISILPVSVDVSKGFRRTSRVTQPPVAVLFR
jgi:hypothetical protein